MADYLYALFIYPIEMFVETVFTLALKIVPSVGYAIVFVSIAVQLLVLPIYKRAEELQEEERDRQRQMLPAVEHIKRTFRGDERVMMLSTYYRVEGYHQYYQLKTILPLLLQIPFFIAAYHFLSNCKALDSASFYFLADMGRPDQLINAGGFRINVMPILMTLINIASGMIYTKGLSLKDRLQPIITAGVFLIILYNSPSGLVFYWTLNNVFSLVKTVFMKVVKNSKPVICVLSVLLSSGVFIKCMKRGTWDSDGGQIIMLAILIAGFVPLVIALCNRFMRGNCEDASKEEKWIFIISAFTSSIVLGVLIPTGAMSTSPAEFVIKGNYVSPLVQIAYVLAVAAGLCIVWGGVLFAFSTAFTKKVISYLLFASIGCGLVNYLFFSSNLKKMSNHMQYYEVNFFYSNAEKLKNVAVLAMVFLVTWVIYRYFKKAGVFAASLLLVVTMAVSIKNVNQITTGIEKTPHIKDDDYYINGDAHFEVDKTGKNVMIVMLDRAFGQYLPYILHEKPELEKSYSGFTFYPNTLSHGGRTQLGAPALFGGYDYTAYKVKDMQNDEYKDYISDSIKVLPTLFDSEGYNVTVLDPPFDQVGLLEKSIEDVYSEISPRIHAYNADGVIRTKQEAKEDYDYFVFAARKNYIRHSLFITSPLFLRRLIEDNGAYLMQERIDDRLIFDGHIEALNRLPNMTRISDEGRNTFTIIENDATHSMNVELQMPDYVLTKQPDNTDLLADWRKNLEETPGNRPINMYTDMQIQSYEVNMATLISVGKWLDYLKKNDLYDNTRIVIVSDHGYWFHAFDDQIFEKDGGITDLERYAPLLMVKDFNETGDGIKYNDEFMTNADVPTIITNNLISDPINPYTGNPINTESKLERDQYVYDIERWLKVHDNIYDLNNWDVVDIDFKNMRLDEFWING